MQNQEIVKIIDNLKGRRGYEEKRASKLGFASLYEYFEDKISKKQKAIQNTCVLQYPILIKNIVLLVKNTNK